MKTPTTRPRTPSTDANQRRSGDSEIYGLMEFFNVYTRFVFGATVLLAALCVLLDQIGGTF